MKLLLAFIVGCQISGLAYAADVIKSVKVRGNAKVEAGAITTILRSKVGKTLNAGVVKEDILALHELGYFSDIRVFKEPTAGGIRLIVEVKEKPAVVSISFVGLDEVGEDDFKEKLETELFAILDEGAVTNDVRMIEKMYLEKGFYLAKASYKLTPLPNNLIRSILSLSLTKVARFLSAMFTSSVMSTSLMPISSINSSPDLTLEPQASRGRVLFITMTLLSETLKSLLTFYKDQGFAEVQVGKPVTVMDQDRKFVRVTMEVEEGIQYSIGSIKFSGDILYDEKEMREWMLLKDNELFRFTLFRKDIETLIDKYGDKGYAFADVNPRHRFDREKKLVHLDYNITKGEKVYFGEFRFVGNTKTRDNVIRRELEVSDGELYSGTRLSLSKRNIERLGFFEEVQTIKKRDEKNPNVLNYKFKVKEKATGQLQAALGFSPSGDSSENKFFGQGRYSEENQSGRGYQTSFTGRWNGGKNYSLELGFRNPRVNDSHWSFGINGSTRNEVRQLTTDVRIQESRNAVSVSVGKRIIELIRASIAVRFSKITQDSDTYTPLVFFKKGKPALLSLL